MGMSIEVSGLISNDNELYKKHAKVLIACVEADVEKLPAETAMFFNEEYADENLLEGVLKIDVPFQKRNTDSSVIHEIKVSEIDPKTDIIRFIQSW